MRDSRSCSRRVAEVTSRKVESLSSPLFPPFPLGALSSEFSCQLSPCGVSALDLRGQTGRCLGKMVGGQEGFRLLFS